MATLNKVMLIGNLTRDPEIRYTQGGASVCSVSIAVNERCNSGERKALFVDAVAWGKLADSVGRTLSKGLSVCIVGRLTQQIWIDREQKSHSKIIVTVEDVQFLSRKTDCEHSNSNNIP